MLLALAAVPVVAPFTAVAVRSVMAGSAAALVPEDAVRAAVFRYQFDHNVSGQKQRAGVYCLALSLPGDADHDPSTALVAAFAGHVPPVKPVSRCTHAVDGVYDAATRARGLIFYVRDVTITGDAATASGGYYEGGLSASGNAYRLRRDGDVWRVTGADAHWIS